MVRRPSCSLAVLMGSTFTVNQIVYRWHVQYKMLQLWRIVGLWWPWPLYKAFALWCRAVAYPLTPMLAVRTTSLLNY